MINAIVARPVRVAYVEYIGEIWQPGVGACAQHQTLTDYDLGNLGELTRENVEHWLTLNAGDFQAIIDFSATVGDVVIPWSDEESEWVYLRCMYPEDD